MSDRDCAPPDGTPIPFPTRPGAAAVNHVVDVTLDLEHDPICPGKLLWKFQLGTQQSRLTGLDYEITNYLKVQRNGVTQFNLHLEGTNFRFYDPGIRLLSSIPAEFRGNYFRASMISDTLVTFLAEYIDSNEVFHHHCLVYAKDITKPSLTSDPIDPDILNPGDHP
ncbi:MAG: hypothetical protein JOZ72_01930 [Alphaproteobacteria bacterium]|nr:hypothetical protein [Alphaproteobacteria bacterium]